MLLLFAEWRELGGRGVLVPGTIAQLRFGSGAPMSIVVPPDGKPRLQKAAGDAEPCSSRTGQQLREGSAVLLLSGDLGDGERGYG